MPDPEDPPRGGRRAELPLREIHALVERALGEAGAELVELQVGGAPRRPLLRVYVDVPGGTTVEACAELSRRVEALLDARGGTGQRWVLEVSSPGLDRPLRTRRDFERLRGRSIVVRLREPGAGRHELVGVLEEVGGELGAGEGFWIRLRPERRAGGEVRLSADQIASAKPHVGW